MVATPLFAQTGLTRKQAEIHKRKAQLEDCLSQAQSKQAELHRIEAKYEELKRDHRDKEDKRSQAKDAYTRASRNVDIITPEQLSKLLAEYQEAEKELGATKRKLKQVENQNNEASQGVGFAIRKAECHRKRWQTLD